LDAHPACRAVSWTLPKNGKRTAPRIAITAMTISTSTIDNPQHLHFMKDHLKKQTKSIQRLTTQQNKDYVSREKISKNYLVCLSTVLLIRTLATTYTTSNSEQKS
jgi:hypothetical protein